MKNILNKKIFIFYFLKRFNLNMDEKENKNSNNKAHFTEDNAVIKLKKYTLKKIPIGIGNFGKVYLAIDDKKNFYAAKSIDNLKLKNPITKEKFIRELCLTNKLKNKHIIKLHDVIKTKSNIYLFLEYCDGETLESFLKNYKKLFNHLIPMELIQYFTKQIIEGMYYMYKKKCIHRDLKLENIMLSKNLKIEDETKLDFLLKESRTKILNDIPTGVSIFTFNCFNEPTETPNYYNENIRKDEKLFIQIVKNYIIKIIDLGFTREIEEEEENNNLKSFCGSPYEMAPEIWDLKYNKGDKSYNYDYRVDLWSIGIVLYKLAFDSIPFNGKEFKTLYYNILKGDYHIPPHDCVSIEFIDLINGLLKINPNARYSWEDLINHPFINKNINDFTYYDFKYSNPLDLNCNDYQKCFLNKNKFINENSVFKNSNNDSNNDNNDNENDNKFIEQLFIDDKCTIIEYSTICEEMNNGWVYTRLNNYLEDY